MKKLSTLFMLTMLASAVQAADTMPIYNWKTPSGSNAYSDTPNNLKIGGSNTINIRTGTITPPRTDEKKIPTTAAEARQLANELGAAELKRDQEAAEEQNRQIKADNCKTAQMNRANAEKALNKGDLIAKYDADVAKYCN